MNEVAPNIRDFACVLIAYEARENNPYASNVPATFAVCEKLRPYLATLMGNGGFRALLSRSLALASEKIHWLRAVHVKADGSLEGSNELYAELDPRELLEGKVLLLARLLALLAALVGEDFTFRLVREVWPKVPLDDFDFDKGGKNEKQT
jgi:hypothetical protein